MTGQWDIQAYQMTYGQMELGRTNLVRNRYLTSLKDYQIIFSTHFGHLKKDPASTEKAITSFQPFFVGHPDMLLEGSLILEPPVAQVALHFLISKMDGIEMSDGIVLVGELFLAG